MQLWSAKIALCEIAVLPAGEEPRPSSAKPQRNVMVLNDPGGDYADEGMLSERIFFRGIERQRTRRYNALSYSAMMLPIGRQQGDAAFAHALQQRRRLYACSRKCYIYQSPAGPLAGQSVIYSWHGDVVALPTRYAHVMVPLEVIC